MCCSLYLIIQSQGGREYKGVGETARVSPTPLYFMRQGRGMTKLCPSRPLLLLSYVGEWEMFAPLEERLHGLLDALLAANPKAGELAYMVLLDSIP